MPGIKHILVATDGSESAVKAAAFAGELARGLGVKVTALIVHSEDILMPQAWAPGEYPAAAPYASMTIAEIQAMIEERAATTELPDTKAALGALEEAPQLVQRWGHPAEEICRYAVDNAVDLIVLGSHGRSGFVRLLLGSVSHTVANHATCPVTIVR